MKRISGLLSDTCLWVAASVFFLAGILLPMFTFHKLVLFHDSFSLLGGVIHLLLSGEVFLFAVIAAFSILGPVYKLYLIGVLIRGNHSDPEKKTRIIKRLAIAGKWSMADVFVVAIIVSTIKFGVIASVSVHIGIVFFGLAVLLSMWLVQRQMAGYEFRPVAGKDEE